MSITVLNGREHSKIFNGCHVISAHTTQFVREGWRYLEHGSGVYQLAHGGSVVSMISPDMSDFTVIFETMVRF